MEILVSSLEKMSKEHNKLILELKSEANCHLDFAFHSTTSKLHPLKMLLLTKRIKKRNNMHILYHKTPIQTHLHHLHILTNFNAIIPLTCIRLLLDLLSSLLESCIPCKSIVRSCIVIARLISTRLSVVKIQGLL